MAIIIEIVFLSLATIISIICGILIGRQVLIKPNALRLTCFFCTLLNISLLIFGYTRLFIDFPDVLWYYDVYLLLSAIYSEALCICILNLGQRFYPRDYWNTSLFKFAVVSLILSAVSCLTTVVIVILDCYEIIATIFFIISLTSFVICGWAAFTYSFLPIFSSHSHVQSHLNHFNTAIGIYYMVSLGIIACASVVCHIFLHISGGPSSAVWQIGASVDIILRSIVIIIVGTPPPERLIQKLRIKLFERAIVNVTLRERGVVSTGIIMDEFCGWKMDQQIN
ncbi:hypothetical protein F8M41_013841 [Gigaspora margarita]|uniref:Uncharacterized protein n=1 Tax=Gigaspora margarita TaxID=4874 RepID=A0A8H4EP25_GIGMA|nr:hypothetical protein F8M41_013841 [Gigaspora margarita]